MILEPISVIYYAAYTRVCKQYLEITLLFGLYWKIIMYNTIFTEQNNVI